MCSVRRINRKVKKLLKRGVWEGLKFDLEEREYLMMAMVWLLRIWKPTMRMQMGHGALETIE